MARGGAREGAGRPKGSTNARTREIAEKAAAEGIMPLDVMLRAMREHADAGRWDEAAKIAASAAPYLHRRLAAIEHSGASGSPIQFVSKAQRDAAVRASYRANT